MKTKVSKDWTDVIDIHSDFFLNF